jgi:MFS family permease
MTPLPPKIGWRAVPAVEWVILINIVLYAVCFQMQQPIQPYLVQSLVTSDDAAAQYASFRSFGGLLQVLGSLLSGWLIDRFGTKYVLLLSFGSSALSYGLAACATDIRMLFLSQIPTIFQHAMLGARAFVFITADDSTRAARLGYIGAAYGIGYVIGPVVGGQIGKVSLQLAAGLAAFGSLLSAISLIWALPSTQAQAKQSNTGNTASVEPTSLLQDYVTIWSSAPLRGLLVTKLLLSLSGAVFHTMLPLMAKDQFGLDAAGTG